MNLCYSLVCDGQFDDSFLYFLNDQDRLSDRFDAVGDLEDEVTFRSCLTARLSLTREEERERRIDQRKGEMKKRTRGKKKQVNLVSISFR